MPSHPSAGQQGQDLGAGQLPAILLLQPRGPACPEDKEEEEAEEEDSSSLAQGSLNGISHPQTISSFQKQDGLRQSLSNG